MFCCLPFWTYLSFISLLHSSHVFHILRTYPELKGWSSLEQITVPTCLFSFKANPLSTITTITVWLSGKLIHVCVHRIKEQRRGKSLRVYYVTRLCSGMTVKTFMTPNLYKHDMQSRAGNRMLTRMGDVLKEIQRTKKTKKKKTFNLVLLMGGEIILKKKSCS